MAVPAVIRQRLSALGVEPRELATAANGILNCPVTDSEKAPPMPNRTDRDDRRDCLRVTARGAVDAGYSPAPRDIANR